MATITLNDKKTINAWCMYDWANSAYSLVISSTLFPVYYEESTKLAFPPDGIVDFLGFQIKNTVLYSYSLSFAYLLIAISLPFLSGIADYTGRKSYFMRVFSTMGAVACGCMIFFNGHNVELGIATFVVATMGYAGGLVFYNAFLPEIVTQDKFDSTSARGFSFGYIGSVLLLVINLAIIQAQPTGEAKLEATKWAFLMVGIWWIAFSMITFHFVKDANEKQKVTSHILTKGIEELKGVIAQLQNLPNAKRFLTAFFLYDAGVQTAMFLAPLFAKNVLNMDGGQLIKTVLILQVVAILGSYLAAKLSEWKGNKVAIMVLLVIWTVNCFLAYTIQTQMQFYFVAACIGMVMGGIQSLSRATYAKLIPENTPNTASFFSFFDLLDKIALVLGAFLFGYIELITGSMRNSILALGVFFVTGAIVMLRTKVPFSRKV